VDAAYDTELTALLVIDPYNDFTSEGGKVWERRDPRRIRATLVLERLCQH